MSKLFYLLLSALLFASLAFAEIAEDTETEKADDQEFDTDVEGFFFNAEKDASTRGDNGDEDDDEHKSGAGHASDKKYQCGRRGALAGKYAEDARMEDEAWKEFDDAAEKADENEANTEANTEANNEANTDANTEDDKGTRADTNDEDAKGTRADTTEDADGEDEGETANENITEGEDDSVRMVGGRTTTSSEFPWQVSIFYKNKHLCSGAIIGKRYIITNAHCFKGRSRRSFKIYAAKQYKDAGEEGVQVYRIQAIVSHGKYGKGRNVHDNDIALIKLNKNIKFSRKVSPVCLPEQDETVKKVRCFVSGFAEAKGTLEDGELRGARVSVTSNRVCKRKGKSWFKNLLTNNMVCAGGISTDTGSVCKGDSGSPLVCEAKRGSNVFILQGLFSFGKRDCLPREKVPGAYTRLSKYVLWMKKNYRRLQKFKPRTEERWDDNEEDNEEDTRFEAADDAVLADEE